MLFLQVMFSRYSVGKCSRLCYGGFRLSVWNQKPCVEASLPLLKHLPWFPAAPDKCRQVLPGWGPRGGRIAASFLDPTGHRSHQVPVSCHQAISVPHSLLPVAPCPPPSLPPSLAKPSSAPWRQLRPPAGNRCLLLTTLDPPRSSAGGDHPLGACSLRLGSSSPRPDLRPIPTVLI